MRLPPLKLRWTGLLLAYARERLTPAKVLPAVLLVVVATLAGRGWSGIWALAIDVLLALALVVAFRIWDDLVDRDRDRTKHPDRVIVRASTSATTPLRAAGWMLVLAATVALHFTQGPGSVLFLWIYTALLATSYARRSLPAAASAKAGPAAERILLLKYGVFTLALIGLPGGLTARGLSSAAAAFLAACVYEWWHDAESPVLSGKALAKGK
jgi:4-hydroxybenzoate polyprenyltransferase